MGLLFSVAVALLLMWFLAPLLGAPGREVRAKGLSAFQTLCTLAGITLIGAWYMIERPDAARLKFEQKVLGVPTQDGQAIVAIEIEIENVGGHEARFEKTPYTILIQQVSPLDPAVLANEVKAGPTGYRGIADANNWTEKDPGGKLPGLLAYRIGGKSSGSWRQTHPGFSSLIQPKESDFYYYRAILPCREGLVVSISSRFRTIPGPIDRLWSRNDLVWIKQSFLDLSDVCRREAKE